MKIFKEISSSLMASLNINSLSHTHLKRIFGHGHTCPVTCLSMTEDRHTCTVTQLHCSSVLCNWNRNLGSDFARKPWFLTWVHKAAACTWKPGVSVLIFSLSHWLWGHLLAMVCWLFKACVSRSSLPHSILMVQREGIVPICICSGFQELQTLGNKIALVPWEQLS